MNILPLMIALPLGMAFFIPMVSRKNGKTADFLGNLTAFSLFIMSLFLLRMGNYVYFMGGWKPPLGINLVLDGYRNSQSKYTESNNYRGYNQSLW